MKSFTELGLKKEITDVLSRLKFNVPFEVQEKIIPLALSGKNIVFTSKTGSGKTLAYLLGFLSKINKKLGIQMMILVPTRELCIQVGKEVRNICEPLGFNAGVLYGGRAIKGDYKTNSKKNHIIVGTPGRLMHHINSRTVRVGEVKCLVYDESDQMFDQGFYDDCVYLKKRVSKESQIILASATITNKVHDFIKTEIGNYELLNIGSFIPDGIKQEKVFCAMTDKNDLLLKLLSGRRFKRALIFCNTKVKSHYISQFLEKNKFRTRALNSDLEQTDRQNYLNLFKQGRVQVLIATDVAARGLHIENVDMVVNYDVPTRGEFYIHRIGRTGRSGKSGYALTFICPEDEDRFDNIEFDYELKINSLDKNLKKINIDE